MIFRNTHTNASPEYQLVGNCKTVISSHETREQANAALQAMGLIEETGFGVLEVVAPGETVSSTFRDDQLDLTAEKGQPIFGVSFKS